MLEDIYPIAVQAGIRADEYWYMTLDEIMMQTMANTKRQQEEIVTRARMDHELAQLMAYALNEPSKMPSPEEAYPFLRDFEPKEEPVPDWKKDQMELMLQAQKIKHARENK
ncbi:hypothetical protein [Ligilactobacillus salivarius]|nr:hypothetical protein [Ligilactobacillus salivarius]PAY53508.1 hypothetical protein A8C37_04940 [Ligilactobacillus salivarius]